MVVSHVQLFKQSVSQVPHTRPNAKHVPTLTAVFPSSSEYRVAAPPPILLLVLILDCERGRLAGRVATLFGRCMLWPFGELGGEVFVIVAILQLGAQASADPDGVYRRIDGKARRGVVYFLRELCYVARRVGRSWLFSGLLLENYTRVATCCYRCSKSIGRGWMLVTPDCAED